MPRKRKPVETDLPASLVESLEWYALLIVPQKEFLTQSILHEMGFTTFLPVVRKWGKRNKFSGQKTFKSYPLIPGYLFVGFVNECVVGKEWFDVFTVPSAIGVIGTGGEPCPIPVESMLRLTSEYRNGLHARPIRVGDTVQVVRGPFVGQRVPVIDIGKSGAKIVTELFGSPREIDIAFDNLESL